MNVPTEKLKIIDWIIALQDASTIEKLKFLKNNSINQKDWWECIAENEKQSIESGLSDIESGRVVKHIDVKSKYEKWL
jgi:predicted transcriptional regulator